MSAQESTLILVAAFGINYYKGCTGSCKGRERLSITRNNSLDPLSVTIKNGLVSREGIGRWSKIEASATVDMQKFWERSCAQELAID